MKASLQGFSSNWPKWWKRNTEMPAMGGALPDFVWVALWIVLLNLLFFFPFPFFFFLNRLLEYLFTLHLCCINAMLQSCYLPVASRKEFPFHSERILWGVFLTWEVFFCFVLVCLFAFFCPLFPPYHLLKHWRLLQVHTQGWQSILWFSLAVKSFRHLVSVSCFLSLDFGSSPLSPLVQIGRDKLGFNFCFMVWTFSFVLLGAL